MIGSDRGVLIFGGGLIGTAAASAFLNADVPTTVITRAAQSHHLSGATWQFGTAQGGQPDELFAGRRAVIFAAGSMSPASRPSSVSQSLIDHVLPAICCAEQAARLGVPVFVFISSGGTVYGRAAVVPTREDSSTFPINAYGMIKVQTEQALLEIARRSKMRVMILRVSNPYGPAQQANRQLGFVAAAVESALLNEPLTIWGDGLNTRDFVYLDDVAQAIRLAAEDRGQSAILNIGSGQRTSLLEVCDVVGRVFGKPIDIKFDRSREVDVRDSALDVARAKQVLGWQAGTSLEQGLDSILKHRRRFS